MDEHLHTCLLIDYYGSLLTDKQSRILDMYYNNDYSLAEISQLLGITRQAVSDNKNRACEALLRYEKILGLVGKCSELNVCLADVIKQLAELKSGIAEKGSLETIGSIEEKIGMIGRVI
jgi:uncharacterized protein